ncbi:P-loop containing nucleoside triphosphate hydrolase protein [Syncephalis fuscata]|nr:P-loop containing nucleoside triphosphate hydrolase protein [Syncephalis fuscata]
MPTISTETLTALQKQPDKVRNLCILAHVDHGKTTLSDSLVASNGVISQKLAGKVRYLDSREDEQERGITMESSSISLFFQVQHQSVATTNRTTGESDSTITNNEPAVKQPVTDDYLINLIDSPGHVDFSSEVSTASRLCDGALVLVDVVEGVCTQTHAVLRQARQERVRPLLVLNKIDRLATELRLTPMEAYQHLRRILEQVNAVMGQLFADERVEGETRKHELQKEQEQALFNSNPNSAVNTPTPSEAGDSEEVSEDDRWFFAPEHGNVIFASAIDGWAFRVKQFSQMYAARLGVNETLLRRTFWGDYYIDPKTKRVIGHRQLKGRPLKPIFVQMALDNIWAVYHAVAVEPDAEKVQKIVKTLNIKVLPRDLRSKEPRTLLSTIFGQWLPLSASVLLGVVDRLPSPVEAQPERLHHILYPDAMDNNSDTITASNDIETALYGCDNRETAPVAAFVTKMLSIPSELLPEHKKRSMTAEEMRERGRQIREARAARQESESDHVGAEPIDGNNALIGYARVYSGILRVGQSIRVLGPKYDPARPNLHTAQVTISSLYMLMGRDLVMLSEVPAGNVCGIGGLDGVVLKTATLTDQHDCPSFGALKGQSAPIVRVAVEPSNPTKMSALVEGLRLLSQADPCAEVVLQTTGEHVLMTAGELHLERCIKDLRERFAKIDIRVSPPIVPFRETIVAPSNVDVDAIVKAKQAVALEAANGRIKIQIRARPLPKSICTNEGIIDINSFETNDISEQGRKEVMELKTLLQQALKKERDTIWHNILDSIWTFGPKRIGPNLLINQIPNYQRKSLFDEILLNNDNNDDNNTASSDSTVQKLVDIFDENIATGFQMATQVGPLCAEPCVGIGWFVESFDVTPDQETADTSTNSESQNYKSLTRFSGQVITLTRDACRKAFLQWSPRLMLAVYICDIQATSEVLGRVYGVVSRRRGRVVSEEMDESTALFTIQSKLPVVESFGFADEIRKRTSGAAIPQLIFSGYEILDEDPFWVPTTEEELEDLGEKSDRENVARRYMDAVRKRKGMFVEKKITEHAEKQRTLKK